MPKEDKEEKHRYSLRKYGTPDLPESSDKKEKELDSNLVLKTPVVRSSSLDQVRRHLQFLSTGPSTSEAFHTPETEEISSFSENFEKSEKYRKPISGPSTSESVTKLTTLPIIHQAKLSSPFRDQSESKSLSENITELTPDVENLISNPFHTEKSAKRKELDSTSETDSFIEKFRKIEENRKKVEIPSTSAQASEIIPLPTISEETLTVPLPQQIKSEPSSQSVADQTLDIADLASDPSTNRNISEEPAVAIQFDCHSSITDQFLNIQFECKVTQNQQATSKQFSDDQQTENNSNVSQNVTNHPLNDPQSINTLNQNVSDQPSVDPPLNILNENQEIGNQFSNDPPPRRSESEESDTSSENNNQIVHNEDLIMADVELKALRKQAMLQISKFDGSKPELNRFIKATEEFIKTIPQNLVGHIPALLVFIITHHTPSAIFEKLNDKTVANIDQFRTLIRKACVKAATLDDTLLEISKVTQKKSESIEDFANRIKRYEVDLTIGYAKEGHQEDQIEGLVQKTLFRVFMRSVKPTLNSVFLAQKLSTIEECVESIKDCESFASPSVSDSLSNVLQLLTLQNIQKTSKDDPEEAAMKKLDAYLSKQQPNRNWNQSNYKQNFQRAPFPPSRGPFQARRPQNLFQQRNNSYGYQFNKPYLGRDNQGQYYNPQRYNNNNNRNFGEFNQSRRPFFQSNGQQRDYQNNAQNSQPQNATQNSSYAQVVKNNQNNSQNNTLNPSVNAFTPSTSNQTPKN